MSETTQNVATILSYMMRMDDADFDHTLDTLQEMKRNRAKQSIKKLYVNQPVHTYNNVLDVCGKIGD